MHFGLPALAASRPRARYPEDDDGRSLPRAVAGLCGEDRAAEGHSAPHAGTAPVETPPPATPRGHTVQGIASFMPPRYGPRYLALPGGAGQRVRICGPAACVVRTSTDAGPDKAMQRAGRVADLSHADFAKVCGCDPWIVGLVRVTVATIPAPPVTVAEP
jgi:hypothetical protein